MAATITQNSKPLRPRALDTSGNNNHGTAYTGQALEFDGVGDYITMPLTFMNGATAVSISLWFNTTESNSGMIAKYASSSMYAWWINVQGGKLTANINANRTATSDLTSTSDVNDGNWHYATLTWSYSSGLASLYLDGLLIDTDANTNETDLRNGSLNNTIGFQGYISSGTLNEQGAGLHQGLLSNVQIWDTVLTASDVAYAYANPEKLVLDNPLKSIPMLTYSNLKLWYPMNDSTRGSQINVIDGANTGLSDELVDNLGWSTALVSSNGWVQDSSNPGTWTVYTSGDVSFIIQSLIMSTSVSYTYKLTYTITNSSGSGSSAQLRLAGGNSAFGTTNISGENGTHTYYLQSNASKGNLQFNENGFIGTISNISLKGINLKSHGTSTFYGDELITNGTMEADSNWADRNIGEGESNTRSTEQANNGTYSRKIVATANDSGCKSDNFSVVAGRAYLVECYVYVVSGTCRIQRAGGYVDVTVSSTGTGSWEKLSGSAISTATNDESFKIVADGGASTFYVDDVSVKEIGFATGWTDADAQSTIPQLGFQSYNQLAWFDGTADHVSLGSQSTGADASITFSAWIYMLDGGSSAVQPILRWGDSILKAQDDTSLWMYPDSGVGKTDITVNSLFDKWHHVVATSANGDPNNTNTIYLDGVLIGSAAGGGDTSSDSVSSYIGRDSGDRFSGCITEVSYWEEALTLAKVEELYNDGEALDATLHSSVANLSGYWRNQGATTWTDLSTNSNNGTATSVTEYLTLPEGQNNRDTQGFLMNRTSTSGIQHTGAIAGSYSRFGYGTKLLSTPVSNASVECWFRSFGGTGASESYATFFGSRASNNILLCRNATAGTVSGLYYLTSGGNQNNLDSTTDCFDDEWHHIAFTFDSGVGKLYIDGSLEDTQDDTGDTIRMGSDTYYMETGADSVQGSRSFSGDVDDIAVYSTTLIANEVLRNYKAGKRRHKN